jgi:hypothetical protein
VSGSSSTIWRPDRSGAGLEVAAVLERVAGRRLVFALGLCDGERPVASGRLTQVADAAGFLRDAGSGASLSTRAVQVSKHLRDGPLAEAAPRRGQQRGHSNARPYH